MSTIDWFLKIMPTVSVPPAVSTWNELQARVAELKRIGDQDLTPNIVGCPQCGIQCEAPKDMEPDGIVICPKDQTPMEHVTWKQFSLALRNLVGSLTNKLKETEAALEEIGGQTYEVAVRMREAETIAKEAQERFDNLLFEVTNKREQNESGA